MGRRQGAARQGGAREKVSITKHLAGQIRNKAMAIALPGGGPQEARIKPMRKLAKQCPYIGLLTLAGRSFGVPTWP